MALEVTEEEPARGPAQRSPPRVEGGATAEKFRLNQSVLVGSLPSQNATPQVDGKVMGILLTWKQAAKRLKGEVLAVYLACRDPRVPWYTKVLAACVAGYALSPLDLIPDPVPVLGYLDDLIIVPLGLVLVLWMIPPAVLAECREKAKKIQEKPTSRVAAGVIIAIWIVSGLVVAVLVLRMVRR